ncbi:unnamed protein product, partial [Meganyctiphanes norvegica]
MRSCIYQNDLIIDFEQVATTGYVGLGFSPSGGMGGADIALGWIDNSGFVHFHDRFAEGNTQPMIDDSQDYDLLGGYQNDSHTVLRFSRPWVSCDDQHDVQLTVRDTSRVIWAYHDEDPADENSVQYHSHRGTKSMFLKEPKIETLKGQGIDYWDVLNPNISLPETLDTIYWCKMVKIPALKKKNQIVGAVPIIQEGNWKYVHHMLLYECHSATDSEEVFGKFVQAKGAQCHTANMPPSWSQCNVPIAAWAVGSEGGFYPDHVGLPLGEEHGGSNYFLLETHYDNPTMDKGVVDSSGIRVYHTDNLREHDAGLLTLGHNVLPQHIIPPGQEFTTVGHCSAECTQTMLPETGINVFQGMLHTHLLGSKVIVRQIRDGKELPTILKDDHYDFNYQEARQIRPEWKVLPGDILMTECLYNSTDKSTATYGGLATQDEMCLSYLVYYPKTNLGGCLSSPSFGSIIYAMGIQELYPMKKMQNPLADIPDLEEKLLAKMLDNGTYDGQPIFLGYMFKPVIAKKPERLANQSLFDIVMDPTTWTDTFVKSFQDVAMYSTHDLKCFNLQNKHIEGIQPTVKYPQFEVYEAPMPTCNTEVQPGDVAIKPTGPHAYTSTSTTSTATQTIVTTITKTSFAKIVTTSRVFVNGTTSTYTTTTSKDDMNV